MRYAPRVLLAGGLGFAVSFVVACGGGAGLLSSDQANNLNNQLDTISSALDSGQCGVATGAASSFGNAVANLPPTVSPKLAANLKQGAATVAQLAASDCHSQRTTTTPTATVTTSSTATHTTTTSNSSSSPTPPPPTHSTPATTPGGSGTTSTGSGGAGLPGASGNSGGAGTANGNGNGQ